MPVSESSSSTQESKAEQAWSFSEDADPAGRQARALEFIAMYLSKIEGHLDRIADASEGRPPKDPEWAERKALKKVMQR